ncbi:MAG: hypothetical protein PHP82_00145 [Candidatus ainarchaeum sp.]|nr:hypothetical protein [Candidatus ainarchaeum sp.]
MDFVKTKEILKTIKELKKDSKKTILKTLDLAENIEITSKEFYEKEAKKNNGNELESFFLFLKKEEEMHLEKIRELQEMLKSKKELKKIKFSNNIGKKIINTKIGKEEMTVLLYALWREKQAQEFYEKAGKKTIGIIKEFFEELTKFEKEHVLLLEEYVESMGNVKELIMG